MNTVPVWKELANAVSSKVEARWYRAREDDDLGNSEVFQFLVFHVNPEKTEEFERFMSLVIGSCSCQTKWKVKQLKQGWRYALIPADLEDNNAEHYRQYGVQVARQAHSDLVLLKEAVENA